MKRTSKYVARDANQATTSATVRQDGRRLFAGRVHPTTSPVVDAVV